MKIVPNEQPKYFNQPYRIAFVGEAPGAIEDECGRPFMGPSGNLLWAVAAKYGIVREACFVGNVCQTRPPNNQIEAFSFSGPEISSGLNQLSADLAVFNPNLVVCLGNTPLKAFKGETGISAWRGSLFYSGFGGRRTKCTATLHPAAILREYSGLPLLHFDLKRARQEGERPELNLPVRDLAVDLSPTEMCDRMDDILARKVNVSIDLEGYWNNMWCISISESPWKGFLVEFNNNQELADECQLWRRLALILQSYEIGKIAQNAAYELFVMQYGHKITIRNVIDDTMLAHWELYCELDKNLGMQASIYTKEPHWKQEREDDDPTTRKLYCCKDSAVTYEIRNVLRPRLTGAQGLHYEFNLSLLDPIIYMECKGINYDKAKAEAKTASCLSLVHRLQWTLNSIAGISMPSDVAGWVNLSREVHCFKKSAAYVNLVSDLVPHSKLTELHRSRRVVEVLEGAGGLSVAAKGELSSLTDISLNVESKNQMADFLYRQLGLPIQYKKEHGKLTTKETTDVLALLTLYKKTQDPTLKLILTIRSIRTRLDTLAASTDIDGRIRCGYNIVGTDTGRLSCYESPTGSGFNLQTVAKRDRDLFIPDPGYYFFQCDLSGADGWTVAAHAYANGDDTMLEDYHYGLKPARNIALLYQHGSQVLRWSREELKEKGRLIDADGWLYFASKRVQHGSNYGMVENTMSDQILKDSYKLFGEPIYVPPSTCAQLRVSYFARYPGIQRWHEVCKQKLLREGALTSANGHRRVFWGRKKEPSGKVNYQTLYSFLSDEPQNNTTYATNLALAKLWTDPENLVNREATEGMPNAQRFDRLQPRRIQPLHQVHDALIGQFRKEETEWATARIRGYFANRLKIAGVELTIPFEGAYGESWGYLKQGMI